MAAPVRILQLISSLEVGGAEKLLLSLVESAQDDPRAEFVVVVMNADVNPTMKAQLDALGSPAYYLDRPEGHKHPKYLGMLLNIIRKHKIDVIHAHNYGSKLWAVLCKLSQPGLQMVMTIHDTGIISRLSGFHHWLHSTLIDLNIAISNVVAQECRAYGIRNVRQIYNGIPVAQFQSNAPKPQNAVLQIINVARMDTHKKGQDILLNALSRCKQADMTFHCNFVGGVYDYNSAAFEKLKQRCTALGLDEQVAFLTNRTDVAALLHESDVFVLPSRFEGLGLVVLEAMAAGVPVIASNIDGPSELIEHEENGLLFDCEDDAQLAQHLMALAESPERRQQLSAAGERFVSEFDIQPMRDRYIGSYITLHRTSTPEKASKKSFATDAVGVGL